MRIDETPLPASMPQALQERTKIARSLRASASTMAIIEGITIAAAGFDADAAWMSPVTLRRIAEHEGPAALESYRRAVAKLAESLEVQGS